MTLLSEMGSLESIASLEAELESIRALAKSTHAEFNSTSTKVVKSETSYLEVLKVTCPRPTSYEHMLSPQTRNLNQKSHAIDCDSQSHVKLWKADSFDQSHPTF